LAIQISKMWRWWPRYRLQQARGEAFKPAEAPSKCLIRLVKTQAEPTETIR
jgi:hypothetical protein